MCDQNGGFCGEVFTNTHTLSASFGFQSVSLSDRDPCGGTEMVIPQPEINLTLLRSDRQVWRQIPRDPHGMINKNARHMHTHTRTHTPPCWHLHSFLSPHLFSFCALSAAAAVYLPDLSYCLVCHLQSLALWALLTDRGISCLCLVLRAGLSCWIEKLCMNTTGKHVMTHTGTLPPTAAPLSVCVCVR